MITTAKRKLESDLANLLKCIAFWTINLENQKIQIAENHDFNILYAYSLLDPSQKGYLDQHTFHNFYSSSKINCSHLECENIYIRLFQNLERINFQQFSDLILPKTNQVLKDFQLKQIKNSQPTLVQIQFTKFALIELFEKIVSSYRQINQLQHTLIDTNKNMNVHQLWRIINEKNPNHIGNVNQQNLTDFIKSTGSTLNKDEFDALLRFVHCNPEQGYLAQSQFNQLIIPIKKSMIVNDVAEQKTQAVLAQKYHQLGLAPLRADFPDDKVSKDGYYNIRKVFDPIREGRPQFEMDQKYLGQLRDYQERYIAPCRNYQLQYRDNPTGMRHHDFFFQDYYQHLHRRDQDELFFNRFGKQYAYKE